MDGMMIPFVMLLIVTIALVLERNHHEQKVVDIYEEKFKDWKAHATPDHVEQKKPPKELVGLVFLDDNKLNIELLDNKVQDRFERKKFTVIPKV